MAFWGKSFIFNGIPCDDYDLMLYDIGSTSQSAGKFASPVSIIEETTSSRWKPYFYGVKFDKKLEFSIVFGVDQKRIDNEKYLDRYELETIACWLTGHDTYMWLEVEQSDLEYVRYNCMISNLEIVEFGNIPWALKATVICDSPYAYLYPQEFEFDINGSERISFYNESSHNGYFMPQIVISPSSGGNFTITNETDNNRVFSFTNIPNSISQINVDNDKCIISDDQDINMYPYFNFKFFRLKKGENILSVTGNGTLKFICEFPINAGG